MNAQVYGSLLSLYLLHGDLCNAKFLWRRIPKSVKGSNPELAHVWSVGQKMWQRDYPGIYTALSREWTDNVKGNMEQLRSVTQQNALKIVGNAYSSISITDLASFTGQIVDQATKVVTNYGWTVDLAGNIVSPTKPDPAQCQPIPSSQQLQRLTEFVSFLEN